MSESYYGGTVTVAGRSLIAKLMAGETIEFTRIVVGSGSMPEGTEPIDMKALVTPIAEGTSSVPMVDNNVLSMVVEYRNDMNGGLQQGFWLREFGVFARTEKTKEVLFYYATLGDSPQPVNAYRDGRVDIRRYPISIALELDANVQVEYTPGAFVTSKEVNELVGAEVSRAVRNLSRVYVSSTSVTLTSGKWTLGGIEGYPYQCTVESSTIKASDVPNAVPTPETFKTAVSAGLAGVCETADGSITFWAENVPEADIQMQVTLLGKASSDTPADETTAALGRAILGRMKLNTGGNA